jgi:gamma-glutamyltranspeptidase/glutathione hydrolase
MSLKRCWSFPGLIAVWLCALVSPVEGAEPVYQHGIVASGHPLATEAGLNVLKDGGNAVDAAVATGLTLGVVDGHNSGIGGGCFMLIRLANGSLIAIDGRETAPAAAKKDMFLRDGKADTHLSQTGPLASGVPGELAAFEHAVRNFGTRKLGNLLAPAADLAEKGFSISSGYANRLRDASSEMAKFASSTKVFWKNGAPLKAGDLLVQKDLANTYRAVAREGIGWFYTGPFAEKTEAWMLRNDGILRASDFAAYKVVRREPVQASYRGHTVVSFPPPSSGGVHLIQMLNIIENFQVKALDPATRLHVMAETMKLAFADRAFWLGDPDFAKVPRGLISKSYAADLAKRLNLGSVTKVVGHGNPPEWETDLFKKHTTHFCVADNEGNWVACTATINTGFGSKVVIPGTGVVMNNQMDDFSTQPGVPNFFGLVGGEANSIAPGKRPLSSMTPTIVLANGKPIIALGAAGGPKIISTVFQQLIGMLDLEKSPQDAMAEPRIHHQWAPDELYVEKALSLELCKTLADRGHALTKLSAHSTAQMIAKSPGGDGFVGAADPRSGGSAKGW